MYFGPFEGEDFVQFRQQAVDFAFKVQMHDDVALLLQIHIWAHVLLIVSNVLLLEQSVPFQRGAQSWLGSHFARLTPRAGESHDKKKSKSFADGFQRLFDLWNSLWLGLGADSRSAASD